MVIKRLAIKGPEAPPTVDSSFMPIACSGRGWHGQQRLAHRHQRGAAASDVQVMVTVADGAIQRFDVGFMP